MLMVVSDFVLCLVVILDEVCVVWDDIKLV